MPVYVASIVSHLVRHVVHPAVALSHRVRHVVHTIETHVGLRSLRRPAALQRRDRTRAAEGFQDLAAQLFQFLKKKFFEVEVGRKPS